MKTIKIEKDDKKQIIEIEGIRYSYDFFRRLGQGAMRLYLNQPFVITERKDGVIRINKLKKEDEG